MKIRREQDGLHLYDRRTGLHALLDEYSVKPGTHDVAPAVLSIALTNLCDLKCSFCYAPKTPNCLNLDDVVRWCKEFAQKGTLEVALGGGEPTLYRDLGRLCGAIWNETDLGISITTHGQHLSESLLKSLADCVSIIRVSIDAPEPQYSLIRTRPLERVLRNVHLANHLGITVGINTVVNGSTLNLLNDMRDLVREAKAVDWLLLPEVDSGRDCLTGADWQRFDKWISENYKSIPLLISRQAAVHVTAPVLRANCVEDYAHIRADGSIGKSSYLGPFIRIDGGSALIAYESLRSISMLR